MKRKMVVIGIAYILGLFFASFFVHPWLYVLIAAAGIFLILMTAMHRIERKTALTAMVSFLAGILLYTGYTAQVYAPVVSLQGMQTEFTGSVKTSTVYANEFTVYVLDGAFENGTKASVLCLTENLDCRFGDQVTVSGTFLVPESDYLYDSTLYYQGKSVFLQADHGCTYTVSYTEDDTLVRLLGDYRERIQQYIYRAGGETGGSIAAAMIFGHRAGLDPRVENAFFHAGIGPMLSVSGFHLVLFTGFCNLLGRRTRLQRMLQFGLTAVMTVLFSLVAMWPVSVLRAGVMLLISRSACIFCRRADGLNSLCIAVLILTLVRPYLIHDVGFLLSVTGTFGLNVLAPYMTDSVEPKHWCGVLGKMVLSNMLVTLCTMPICICCFSETSLLAPLSNVIFTPMCEILMVCAIVIFFCGDAPFLSDLCGIVIDCVGTLLADCLLWMQRKLPISFPLGWDQLRVIALVLCGVLCMGYLLYRSRNVIYLLTAGSLLVLSLMQRFHQRDFWQELRLYVLGCSGEQVAVVTCGGRTDVADLTGDYRNPEYLRTFLTRAGIMQIHTLYLTENVPAMIASYNEALDGIAVDSVYAAQGNGIRSFDTICGQTVRLSDAADLKADGYSIHAEEGIFVLTAEGCTLQMLSKESEEETEYHPDYLIYGSRKQKLLGTPEELMQDTALLAAENIEVTFYKDGNICARGLE